jgi:hypothetical protein
MTELKSRYDTDFLAWSKQQAEALRVAMRMAQTNAWIWETWRQRSKIWVNR